MSKKKKKKRYLATSLILQKDYKLELYVIVSLAEKSVLKPYGYKASSKRHHYTQSYVSSNIYDHYNLNQNKGLHHLLKHTFIWEALVLDHFTGVVPSTAAPTVK